MGCDRSVTETKRMGSIVAVKAERSRHIEARTG